MEHLQTLCVLSTNAIEPTPNGHALMVSCPPFSHLIHTPEVPFQPAKEPKIDLMHLLELSKDLALDGEITPVMALHVLRNHERYGELNVNDFRLLMEELKTKSRCYGFGAVLEEFELQDALTSVLATKLDIYDQLK